MDKSVIYERTILVNCQHNIQRTIYKITRQSQVFELFYRYYDSHVIQNDSSFFFLSVICFSICLFATGNRNQYKRYTHSKSLHQFTNNWS